jgi:hypothetical protein
MITPLGRWAVTLIAGALWVPGVTTADLKPDTPSDTVTVRYRGKTHTLTGKDAATVRDAALDLLRTSCREIVGTDNDREIPIRYDRARKRSHVLVTFAKPIEIPKAGNNKIPVRVESLMVPFSPDLDPESVYVLPGRPFRMFQHFVPEACEPLHEALVKAGIYSADAQ